MITSIPAGTPVVVMTQRISTPQFNFIQLATRSSKHLSRARVGVGFTSTNPFFPLMLTKPVHSRQKDRT
jgi:hypothetical protein